MKILITTFDFYPSNNGVANVVYQQAEGLSALGHDVTVFTKNINYSYENNNFKVQTFNVSGNSNFRSRYKGNISEYVNAVNRFEGDIICCNCWQTWSTDLAVRVFSRVKAKKILISHGVSATIKNKGFKGIINWLFWQPYIHINMPKILKSLDHIIFLSEKSDRCRFYDKLVVDQCGYPNYSIIPNGVNISRFVNESNNIKEKCQYAGKKIILSVGRYDNLKNIKDSIIAYSKANIKNSVFISIGNKKNTYSDELLSLWDRIKVPGCEYVCLYGISQDEINTFFRKAYIFLCSSKTEYFPLVILEAMASKTPFITYDVGCVRDLPGGIVVDSIKSMSCALSQICSDSNLHNKLSNDGYKSCIENYEWSKILDKYEELFFKILSE